jgi:hypothetical protein
MQVKICPKMRIWHLVYLELREIAKSGKCNPAEPPMPLILHSWMSSSDQEKLARWNATVVWCRENGCEHLLAAITDDDYYYGTP